MDLCIPCRHLIIDNNLTIDKIINNNLDLNIIDLTNPNKIKKPKNNHLFIMKIQGHIGKIRETIISKKMIIKMP
jgi:hypothetical protein